jgi:hypothetical protein
MGMKQNSLTLPFPNVRLTSVTAITGDYVWSPAREMTENRDGFLPFRPARSRFSSNQR